MSTYSDPPTPTNDTTMIKLSSSPPTFTIPDPPDMTMLPSPTYSNPPTPKNNTIMIKLSSSPPTFTIPGPPTPTSMPPTPTTLTADTDMSSPSSLTPTSSTPTSPIDMPPPEAITTSNPAYLICYNNTMLVPSVPWDQNLCLQSPDIPDFPSMEQPFFSTPQDEDSDDIHNTTTSTTTSTTTTTTTTTTESITYVEEYSLFPGLEEIEMQFPLQFPLNNHY
ncbi:unnamed protein product [Rhizophagus irregularis]|nr:unnamed protein product [Rhizophagus irregularis]